MTIGLLDHALALCLLVVAPLEAMRVRKQLERRLAEGGADARRKQYINTAAWQWAPAALTIALWVWTGRMWPSLGLSVPGGWGFVVAAGLTTLAIAQLARQVHLARTRPEFAESVRKAAASLEFMLPSTERELRAFAFLSFTAGVVEELLFRGFLIWYFSTVVPVWVAVLASSLAFGIGHAYQGVGGIVKTGVAGLVFAGLYVLAGSLWLPMVLHAAVDYLQVRMFFEARHHIPA